MRTVLTVLGVLVVLLLLAVGGLLAWAASTAYEPAPEEAVAVDCPEAPEDLVAGQPFTVLSWNLQFGGSREHHFFYDGGDAVHVPPEDVARAVGAISRVLEEQGPAVALLQEVDRDSKRTGRKDQLPAYEKAARAACTASAPYHRSPFVPSPTTNPLGRVDMHLAILSRAPMQEAVRHQLALLDEPWIRRIFNLKRALLTAEIAVVGLDQPLAVAVTHLSAFSRGDGTLARQVAALDAWMSARPPGQPWILAGDMNLLPPGDDKTRLTTEADLYADKDNPIEALVPRYTEILGDQLAPENRTYLPFGTSEPDRKIDYVFVGGPVHVLEARVLREHGDVSDHLPVVARLVIGDPPQPAEPAEAAAPALP